MWTAGEARLPFTHHVEHLDSTYDRPSGCRRLKGEHRSDSSFEGTVILFDAIVWVGTLPDPDWLQFAS